jgi:hypothetical protein
VKTTLFVRARAKNQCGWSYFADFTKVIEHSYY